MNRGAVLVLLPAVLLAACTAGGGEPSEGPGSAGSPPPSLASEVVWSSGQPYPPGGFENQGRGPAWRWLESADDYRETTGRQSDGLACLDEGTCRRLVVVSDETCDLFVRISYGRIGNLASQGWETIAGTLATGEQTVLAVPMVEGAAEIWESVETACMRSMTLPGSDDDQP